MIRVKVQGQLGCVAAKFRKAVVKSYVERRYEYVPYYRIVITMNEALIESY
jgi:hypothetical protein